MPCNKIIFINWFHEGHFAKKIVFQGDWVASKWKDLVHQFHKKEKSGDKGKTIEEKAASWRFYSVMSFRKPSMAGQK